MYLMRRVTRYLAAITLTLLAGYVIALHGFPIIAKGITLQLQVQREGDSRVARWSQMFVPGL
jgi:hypothetical protein